MARVTSQVTRRLTPPERYHFGASVRSLMVPLELMEIAVPARAALDIDTWHDQEQALAEGSHDG